MKLEIMKTEHVIQTFVPVHGKESGVNGGIAAQSVVGGHKRGHIL